MRALAFEAWRKEFERMPTDTPAWNAFRTFVNELTKLKAAESGDKPQWFRDLDIDDDRGWSESVRTYVLRLIYRLTLPPLSGSESKLKQDAYTRRALAKLTNESETFVTHLEKTSVWVSNKSKEYELDLSPLLQAYKTAAGYSRQFLKLLEKPYAHKPALSDHFLAFFHVLDRIGLTEPESLELLRFSLFSHGYPAPELDELIDQDKIRAGLFRKRKLAGKQRVASFFDLALGGDGKTVPGKSIHLFWNVRKNQPPK